MDIAVEISIFKSEFKVDDSLLWCKENKIQLVNYKVLHSENQFGRGIIRGFMFKFLTEEDAVAFKLRWI